MVELQLPKLIAWVRFPSSAPPDKSHKINDYWTFWDLFFCYKYHQ